MDPALQGVVDALLAVAGTPDAQTRSEGIVREAVADPDVAEAIGARTGLPTLEAMAIHRSPALTVLAMSLRPGFAIAPHNHNLWSIVGVARGCEANTFYKRAGGGLSEAGTRDVAAPGVLSNTPDVIHSIANRQDEPLCALHAYGGDLFGVARSSFDPETGEEKPFDWRRAGPEAGD